MTMVKEITPTDVKLLSDAIKPSLDEYDWLLNNKLVHDTVLAGLVKNHPTVSMIMLVDHNFNAFLASIIVLFYELGVIHGRKEKIDETVEEYLKQDE